MEGFAPDRPEFYLGDPHAAFSRLRDEDPVHWHASGPFWCATRHAEVMEISRRPRLFSSAHGTQLFEIRDRLDGRSSLLETAPSIIRMDPPEHNRHRKLVIGAFTPRMIAALEPRVRELARASVATIRAGAPFDFVEQVAVPMPMFVIAELLGVPGSDFAAFRRWSDAMVEVGAVGPQPETVGIVGELVAYMLARIEEVRRSPRADVLSTLAHAELDGHRLTDAELGIFCLTLLVAGNETTRHLVSGGMKAMLEDRSQWEKLCADPMLLPNAVEEMLRFVSPIQNFARRVERDVELAGRKLKSGEYIVVFYGSANRDESVFGANPDRFEGARREAPRHLAFGFGEHLCLGASLARLEARVVFEELIRLGPGFALAGDPQRIPSTLVNGLAELPVVLDARR